MRKLVLFIHSTLNGVVTGDPSKDKTDFAAWTRAGNIIKEGPENNLLKILDTVDTILLGRGTYEDLVRKWPSVKGAPGGGVVSRLADKINNARKLVAIGGHPVGELKWGDFAAAEQLAGDVEERIRDLKNGDGGDIVIFGSPKLVRSLTDANLIDEYHILVHPVVVNVGERLFDDLAAQKDLHLVDVKPLKEGAILVTYRPAWTVPPSSAAT
ncbi:dihydrofolate reductase family protein [Streptosporangium sp. NPDC023825]|uniref:dihydrofolate reductase family protein n=1 Tax=Streptosporangium sp. NPDC023825 TaxID=3154909 RepID=UPI0034248C8E